MFCDILFLALDRHFNLNCQPQLSEKISMLPLLDLQKTIPHDLAEAGVWLEQAIGNTGIKP